MKTEPGFDLARTFVRIEGQRAVIFAPKGGAWANAGGRTIAAFHAKRASDVHPSMWEMHPTGDEILFLLSGAVDVVLDESAGERRVAMRSRQACLVPRGVWHRLVLRRPSRLLAITPRAGSRLRPAKRLAKTSARRRRA